jgi:toxic protein SymE
MPAKADLRYPLLIVIAVMLLYGIWPGFPPGHPPKTIVCPPCAFQPLQQIVPDYLTRFIRLGDVAEAGFAALTDVSLAVLDDCLLLIPDSREERRLGAMEKQLEAQQQELEQAQL